MSNLRQRVYGFDEDLRRETFRYVLRDIWVLSLCCTRSIDDDADDADDFGFALVLFAYITNVAVFRWIGFDFWANEVLSSFDSPRDGGCRMPDALWDGGSRTILRGCMFFTDNNATFFFLSSSLS